jgi:hypothetical protein
VAEDHEAAFIKAENAVLSTSKVTGEAKLVMMIRAQK